MIRGRDHRGRQCSRRLTAVAWADAGVGAGAVVVVVVVMVMVTMRVVAVMTGRRRAVAAPMTFGRAVRGRSDWVRRGGCSGCSGAWRR